MVIIEILKWPSAIAANFFRSCCTFIGASPILSRLQPYLNLLRTRSTSLRLARAAQSSGRRGELLDHTLARFAALSTLVPTDLEVCLCVRGRWRPAISTSNVSGDTSLLLLDATVPLRLLVCRAMTAGLRAEVGRRGIVQVLLNLHAVVGPCQTLSCVWAWSCACAMAYKIVFRVRHAGVCTTMQHGSGRLGPDHKYI